MLRKCRASCTNGDEIDILSTPPSGRTLFDLGPSLSLALNTLRVKMLEKGGSNPTMNDEKKKFFPLVGKVHMDAQRRTMSMYVFTIYFWGVFSALTFNKMFSLTIFSFYNNLFKDR